MRCSVDTQVLIWTLQRPGGSTGRADQALERMQATILMEHLLADKAAIVVPTIVVAELMVPIPANVRPRFAAEFAKRFECVPFDMKAAAIAAELFATKAASKPDYETRSMLSLDILIAAAAAAAGCDTFFTHDAKARKLAKQVMDAQPLPDRHRDPLRNVELRREFLGEVPPPAATP